MQNNWTMVSPILWYQGGEGKFRSLLIDFQADNIFFCAGNGTPVWTMLQQSDSHC
jgi:hypothetical protein